MYYLIILVPTLCPQLVGRPSPWPKLNVEILLEWWKDLSTELDLEKFLDFHRIRPMLNDFVATVFGSWKASNRNVKSDGIRRFVRLPKSEAESWLKVLRVTLSLSEISPTFRQWLICEGHGYLRDAPFWMVML